MIWTRSCVISDSPTTPGFLLNRLFTLSLTILLIFSIQGCSIKRFARKYVRSASSAISDSLRQQPDPEIARDASATLLLSIDAAISRSPDDPQLLLSGAQAYTTYSSAFIQEESGERAFVLYHRALEYALRASRIAFDIDGTFSELTPDQLNGILHKLDPERVPYVYWTAYAWAGWLVTHPDTILAMADLPKIISLMEAVMKVSPEYNDGGVFLFFGIYESRKPVIAGGDPEKCRVFFERGIAIAGEDALMPRVLFAEYYARSVLDRELFRQTLEGVLAASPVHSSDLNLSNALARRKATNLLNSIDDLF